MARIQFAVHTLPAILATLIAAAGWYYLFYSRTARHLSSIEDEKNNRLRGMLRRFNAMIMLLIALGIAFGTYHYDSTRNQYAFLIVWSAVMLLLLVSVVLALIDVRLTWKLRQGLRERK